MSGFMTGLLTGAAFGGAFGLWVGFKLWRQQYVALTRR